MTPPSFRDDADAERHLTRHLRRMLLVDYYQDTVSEHTITEQHIADAFAHNAHFRRHLDLQGINPETLVACTDEGRTLVSAIINGWVRALRLEPHDRLLDITQETWEQSRNIIRRPQVRDLTQRWGG